MEPELNVGSEPRWGTCISHICIALYLPLLEAKGGESTRKAFKLRPVGLEPEIFCTVGRCIVRSAESVFSRLFVVKQSSSSTRHAGAGGIAPTHY
jgi:hypothetical protein